MEKSIGIFDSGFGGLNILKEIIKRLPQYDYMYLGDTARTPYGTRSLETVYNFTKQSVDFLFKKGCPLVILACNTASSEALRRIQQDFLSDNHPDKKVLGVVIPASEEAVAKTRNKRIGVIATAGTVNSKSFSREIKKIDEKIKVFQQAAPLLVPFVEAGEHKSKSAGLMIEKYLRPLFMKGIDTLVLGCTHYGILEKEIKKRTDRKIKIIVEGKVVAAKLENYLKQHPEIERKINQNGWRSFYTTDLTDTFTVLGSKFFGRKITAEKISLEDY